MAPKRTATRKGRSKKPVAQSSRQTRSKGTIEGSVLPEHIEAFVEKIKKETEADEKAKKPKQPINGKSSEDESKAEVHSSTLASNDEEQQSQSSSEHTKRSLEAQPGLSLAADRVDWFQAFSNLVDGDASRFLSERLTQLENERTQNQNYATPSQIEQIIGADDDDDGFDEIPIDPDETLWLREDEILRAISSVTEAINSSCVASGRDPQFCLLSDNAYIMAQYASATSLEAVRPSIVRPLKTLFLPRNTTPNTAVTSPKGSTTSVGRKVTKRKQSARSKKPKIFTGNHHMLCVIRAGLDGTAQLTWYDSRRGGEPTTDQQTEIRLLLNALGWFRMGVTGTIGSLNVATAMQQVGLNVCGYLVILQSWALALGLAPAQGRGVGRPSFVSSLTRLINLACSGHLDRWTIFAFLRRWSLIQRTSTMSSNNSFETPYHSNRTWPLPTTKALDNLAVAMAQQEQTSNVSGAATHSFAQNQSTSPIATAASSHSFGPSSISSVHLTATSNATRVKALTMYTGQRPCINTNTTLPDMRRRLQKAGIQPSEDDAILRFQYVVLDQAEAAGVDYITYFR